MFFYLLDSEKSNMDGLKFFHLYRDVLGTSSVNVSTSSSGGRSEYVNAGQFGGSSSLQNTRFKILIAILALVLQISVIVVFS